MRRRQEHLKQMKLAEALLKDPTRNFWTEVHSFAGPHQPFTVPVVDGVSGQDNISDLWCKQLYNSSDGALSADPLRTLEMEIYRGIALASSLSKIFEWSILHTWNCYFYTNQLQFGFKPASSTTLCTGVLRLLLIAI